MRSYRRGPGSKLVCLVVLVTFLTSAVLPVPLLARTGPPAEPGIRETIQQQLDDVTRIGATVRRARFDVGALAEQLGPDPARAFSFVRDQIRLDLYPGVLKGAEGCLRTGSGNVLDRSLLLAELLQKQGGTVRFASGSLDPDRARMALDRMLALPSRTTTPSSPPQPPACEGCEDRLESSRQDLDGLVQRSGEEARAIREKLTTSASNGRSAWSTEEAGLLEEAREHVWVQLEKDGGWVDLDPTLQDASVGVALAPVRETLDRLPDSLHQRVSFRVKLRWKRGEKTEEEVALDVTRDTASLQGRAISLVLAPVGSAGPLLPEQARSARRLQANLRIGTETLPGRPIEVAGKAARKSRGRRFSDPGGGLLGGLAGEPGQEGTASTDTIEAAWLEIATEVAGRSQVHRRELFDRTAGAEVPQEDLTLALVRDISILVDVGPDNPDWMAQQIVAVLASHATAFQDAMKRPDKAPRARKGEERTFPMELLAFSQTSWLLADRILRESFPEVRAYRGHPALLTFQSRYHLDDGEIVRLATGYDIVQSPYRTWHRGDPHKAEELAGQLGVMNTLLERYLCGELAQVVSDTLSESSRAASLPEHVNVVGMPEILRSSKAAGLSLTVLSSDEQLEALALPGEMKALARERLGQGHLLVAPSTTSEVFGKPRWGFWEIDPGTGNLLGVLDTGGGQSMIENAMVRSKIAAVQFQLFLFTHQVRVMFLLSSSCLIGLGYMVAVQSGAVEGEAAALGASAAACFLMELFSHVGPSRKSSGGKGGDKTKKADKPPGGEGKPKRRGYSEDNTSDIPNQGKVSRDPDAPPVDAGKQGKHVKGHPNNTDEGRTRFADGVDHVAETQKAWVKGQPVPGQPQARSYDTGKAIGENGETHIKAVMDKKGNIHGYGINRGQEQEAPR